MVGVTANNVIVTQNVFKADDITELIERYTAIAAPLRDRVIGRIVGRPDARRPTTRVRTRRAT